MLEDDRYALAIALYRAAVRDRLTLSGSIAREVLWTSAFMQALVCLLVFEHSRQARKNVPCIALLFASHRCFKSAASSSRITNLLNSVRSEAMIILIECIRAEPFGLEYTAPEYADTYRDAIDDLFTSLAPLANHPFLQNAFGIAELVDFWCCEANKDGQDVLLHVFHWLCRNGCDAFLWVIRVPGRIDRIRKDSWRYLKPLAGAIAQFQVGSRSPDEYMSDSWIVHTIVNLVTTLIKDIDRHSLISMLRVVAQYPGASLYLDDSIWTPLCAALFIETKPDLESGVFGRIHIVDTLVFTPPPRPSILTGGGKSCSSVYTSIGSINNKLGLRECCRVCRGTILYHCLHSFRSFDHLGRGYRSSCTRRF